MLTKILPKSPFIFPLSVTQELQDAVSTIRRILRTSDNSLIFENLDMADAMRFVADVNREFLPVLNMLASINHVSIYVGTLADTSSDDQQLVSLDVASVSLIDGRLQFNCDLGEECEIKADLQN
jgi:hypothetical protein